MSNKIDAIRELSKTKVGNFLYGVAASIIVVLGWFGFVDEPTARLAKDARSQLQQERIELLKESNEICNKILQSPDVPTNYIGLIKNHTESKLRYDASAGAFSAAVRQVCTEAQYAEIEQLAANREEEELAAVEVANMPQMNPKLEERIERLRIEANLKDIANLRSLIEAAKVNGDVITNDEVALRKYVIEVNELLDDERTALENLQQNINKYKVPVTQEYWDKVREYCQRLQPDLPVIIDENVTHRGWDWRWDYEEIEGAE